MKINHIVFYGTLKRSAMTRAHPAINKHLAYKSVCVLPGKLYDMGRYPALTEGNSSVSAELYQIINDDVLAILDDYEANDNDDSSLPGFTRKSVTLLKPSIRAWVYYYNGSPTESAFLATGVWKV